MPPTLRKILVHTSKVASSSLNRLDSSQRKRKKHETRILKDSERTITRYLNNRIYPKFRYVPSELFITLPKSAKTGDRPRSGKGHDWDSSAANQSGTQWNWTKPFVGLRPASSEIFESQSNVFRKLSDAEASLILHSTWRHSILSSVRLSVCSHRVFYTLLSASLFLLWSQQYTS